MAQVVNPVKVLLIGLIRGYQLILSPVLGQRCRFYPSCSHYAVESLKQHTVLRAIFYMTRRILRCHPWHPGGIDPVPLSKINSINQERNV